jgi:hypothetical protein
VSGIEDIITKGRVDEKINLLRGIRRGEKWKPKLQSSKNGINGMMCNVK